MERFGRPFAFRRRRHRPRVRPARRHAEWQVSYRFGVIPGNECGPKAWMASGPGTAARHHAKRRAGVHSRGTTGASRGRPMFTEDTVVGHDWTLLGDQPWRR